MPKKRFMHDNKVCFHEHILTGDKQIVWCSLNQAAAGCFLTLPAKQTKTPHVCTLDGPAAAALPPASAQHPARPRSLKTTTEWCFGDLSSICRDNCFSLSVLRWLIGALNKKASRGIGLRGEQRCKARGHLIKYWALSDGCVCWWPELWAMLIKISLLSGDSLHTVPRRAHLQRSFDSAAKH